MFFQLNYYTAPLFFFVPLLSLYGNEPATKKGWGQAISNTQQENRREEKRENEVIDWGRKCHKC